VTGAFIDHSGLRFLLPAQIVSLVVVTVFIFLWVHRDSVERDYKRSQLLNAGLLVFPLAFVPAYIVLSRNREERISALLRCAGFGIVFFVTIAVSEALVNEIWY
jgi:heme/copper-type cytochrome/quinol oxidase subunit 2